LPAADENHSASGRLAYLDGWRAVAIAFVLFDHFGSSRYFNTGIVGVEFFFVLSGRLMAQMLYVERVPLGRFYFRRFSRVWPSLACLIGVLLVWSHFVPSLGVGLAQALFALTFTFNYAAQFGFSTQPIDHIWSLCIEEHSYLFLGLLAAFARDRPRTLWAVLSVAIALCVADGTVSTIVFKQDYVQTYWRSDVRIASVLLGAACFLAVRNGRLRLGGLVVPALLLVGVVLNAKVVPDPIKYSAGTLCLALFVSNVERAPARVRDVLSWKPLVWIGLISYSLYLWQQPFAFDLSRAIVPRTAHFALAVLAGIVAFYLVERGSRRWLNSHAPPWARPTPR
jgi:peptidoglycan/LPS O-acetylase OafA/YrhL